MLLLLTTLQNPLYIPKKNVNALPYVDIDVETAYQMINNGNYPNLVILDVRDRSEFDSGHLKKAIFIPYSELEDRINELEEHKNREITVYCQFGGRSKIACDILDSHEFTKIYNMLGGLAAWLEKGYPVTTSYLTEILFAVAPNPAKVGQILVIKGILLDQFSVPIVNKSIRIFYRKFSSDWKFAHEFVTDEHGKFIWSVRPKISGFYGLALSYAGNHDYESSYNISIIQILPIHARM
jgi:rhodanese-related sulfurtransferase